MKIRRQGDFWPKIDFVLAHMLTKYGILHISFGLIKKFYQAEKSVQESYIYNLPAQKKLKNGKRRLNENNCSHFMDLTA